MLRNGSCIPLCQLDPSGPQGAVADVPSEQTELLESVQRGAVRGQEKLCPEKRLKAIRSSGPERRDCT